MGPFVISILAADFTWIPSFSSSGQLPARSLPPARQPERQPGSRERRSVNLCRHENAGGSVRPADHGDRCLTGPNPCSQRQQEKSRRRGKSCQNTDSLFHLFQTAPFFRLPAASVPADSVAHFSASVNSEKGRNPALIRPPVMFHRAGTRRNVPLLFTGKYYHGSITMGGRGVLTGAGARLRKLGRLRELRRAYGGWSALTLAGAHLRCAGAHLRCAGARPSRSSTGPFRP